MTHINQAAVDAVTLDTLERGIRVFNGALFGPTERGLPLRTLAARYAAREALIKACGGSEGLRFEDCVITPEASGRPWFALTGPSAAIVAEKGITTLHLSMSHDGGFAIAYVIAEGPGA